MLNKENIIFEPTYTPNQNWIKELDPRHMDSKLSSFAAPKNDKRVITLCKPFAVLSKNSYSAPITLPLGLAYLGGVLEKAGYKKIYLNQCYLNDSIYSNSLKIEPRHNVYKHDSVNSLKRKIEGHKMQLLIDKYIHYCSNATVFVKKIS